VVQTAQYTAVAEAVEYFQVLAVREGLLVKVVVILVEVVVQAVAAVALAVQAVHQAVVVAQVLQQEALEQEVAVAVVVGVHQAVRVLAAEVAQVARQLT
jgi:hypothetical protein